jgi:hypothetical protein
MVVFLEDSTVTCVLLFSLPSRFDISQAGMDDQLALSKTKTLCHLPSSDSAPPNVDHKRLVPSPTSPLLED